MGKTRQLTDTRVFRQFQTNGSSIGWGAEEAMPTPSRPFKNKMAAKGRRIDLPKAAA